MRLALSIFLALSCFSSLGCGSSLSESPSQNASQGQSHSNLSSSVASTSEGEWHPTGSLASARLLHTATLLVDGRVLVMGGYNRSSELYDPTAGTWNRTADALDTHRAATATLLPNGRVLLAGLGDSGLSSQLYDPSSGTWAPTGNLATPRLAHTATPLPGGRVLVTGGADSMYGGSVLSSAEVYDSATGTWTPTGSMAAPRRNHTATPLSNGKVLVTGGSNTNGLLQGSAEVYDPATGLWSPVGAMAVARASHSATLLPGGEVLVAGGSDSDWADSTSAELFHPTTGTWTASGSMAAPRRSHTATLLSNGRVLVAGGFHEYAGILTSAEVYEPTLGVWLAAGPMSTGRYLHTATLLTDGRVLVAAGASGGNQASSEVYSPSGSGGGPEEPVPTEPAGTSLLLQVVDTSGNPIPGAAVSSLGALFSLDSSGHRLFENLEPGRFFARVEALGFTSATAVVQLHEGAHVGTQVTLLPLPTPIPFQAELGGIIQTAQVRVTLPPDAVVDALGQPVTGIVNVTIAPLDPTRQLAAMPGPLEGVSAADGDTVQLESFFMAEVSLWSNGAPVQLAPGKSATLEFLLPESLASQFKAGDTVPAWWFDLDAGSWREEGTGTIQPSSSQPGKLAWVVQVNHFTWWNADAPWTDKSCVTVHVLDTDGVPVRGAQVFASGVSYSGIHWRYTDASGRTCIEIKRGAIANIFAGVAGQPTTDVVTVTGTETAAVCGIGTCPEVQLTHALLICPPGAYSACPYSGPAGTEGQGLCQTGRRQCNVTGLQWRTCVGEVLPAAENCKSPFDEDCDGLVNEDCFCSDKKGQPCYGGPTGTKGVGICKGGLVGCDLFGNVVCQGQQLPMAEACWTTADEDCNGMTEACAPETGPSGWAPTGAMLTPRIRHTETLLPNGKVLISGGAHCNWVSLATAEVYDPATNTWSATGSMASPRNLYTATLLQNGKVLVAGGRNSGWVSLNDLATAEVYDPATGTWSATGSMADSRLLHTATLLTDGKVLVTGGMRNGVPTAMAEVYDPATSTWSATGSMASPRLEHSATLLTNGKVLVSGGNSDYVTTAEVYDPATGTWSATGSIDGPRTGHTSTLLTNGTVLILGGYYYIDLATAEVYDPATSTWSAAGSMDSRRSGHTTMLLPNGKVLVSGGYASTDWCLATAEVYDPAADTWNPTVSMASPRGLATATLLPNGKVLVSGGIDGNTGTCLAEATVYTP